MPINDPTHPSFPHGEGGSQRQYRLCGCTACKAGVAKYSRDLRRKNTYGQTVDRRLVSAFPVRMHLRNLRAQGYTLGRLAREYGLARNSIGFIANGRVTMIRLETYERIMGRDVTTIPTAPYRREPAAPYREHLRRLGANGWPGNAIAKLCGYDDYTDMWVFRDTCRYVSPENAEKLEKVFAEIGDEPGPSDMSRRIWRNKGWLPPIAYDSDGLPDWHAVPDLTERQKSAVRKRRLALERALREDDDDDLMYNPGA